MIFCITAFSLCNMNSVYGDIYMYIDNNGCIHFTNVPTQSESEYVLYVKGKADKINNSIVENKYDEIIREASLKYDVPFQLLKAIIKVESGFDSKAVSKKGAIGLMQIMPENNKDLNVRNPYNPRENIMGGTSYLKQMLTRFEGKLPLALAAYNAGPSAVEKYRDIPPFKETENYVYKVMTYYNILKY